MIAYIVNHRKTPNIIVTIIDTFSADNSSMSIIGNLRYCIYSTKYSRVETFAVYCKSVNVFLQIVCRAMQFILATWYNHKTFSANANETMQL